MTTIKKLHQEWASKVIPHNAPQIQRQEMERAFYSGAYAFFTLQVTEVASLSDSAAEEELALLQHELQDYFRLLGTIPGPHGVERQ